MDKNLHSNNTIIGTILGWLQTAAILIFLTACAGLIWYEPSQPITHNFNHQLHTQKVELDCQFCHYTMDTNGDEVYGMLPKMADCLMCHQEKFDEDECSFCHTTETPGPFTIPVFDHINYSHPEHAKISDWQMQCFDCHKEAHTSTHIGDELLPPMQLCLTCHQDWYDTLQCLHCHNGFDKLPLEPLTAFSHTGNFTETHGPIAQSQSMLCAQCHTDEFCSECHRQENLGLPPDLKFPGNTTMNWVHEGDFLSRHFIEARFSSGQCIRCHSQSFCKDCHEREGIADSHPGQRTDLAANPHPLGFGFREDPTHPNFHGRIARREIVSCAGCHDNGADSICLDCHATIEKGGWGVNPHPRGFQSSLSRRNDRVCLACHVK